MMMMTPRQRQLLVVVIAMLGGCGSSGSTSDGGMTGDGALVDGAPVSDGAPDDSAVTVDAGAPCGTATEIYAAAAIIQYPVVAGGDLYFAETETVAEVKRVAITGGAATPIATAGGSLVGLAVDGSNVYWLDESAGRMTGSLHRKPLGGGADVTMASGLSFAHTMAQDAGNIYFGATRAMRVSLLRVAKTATAPGTEVVVCAHNTSTSGMLEIGISGTTAYWSTASRPSIYSTTTTGTGATCAEQVLGPEQPSALTINGSDLVYATSGTGAVEQIFRQPVGTTARQSIYTGREIQSIGAQGGQIYFAKGRLLRMAGDGTGVTELVAGGAQLLALDATSVYYTVMVGSGGGVGNNDYRICKRAR